MLKSLGSAVGQLGQRMRDEPARRSVPGGDRGESVLHQQARARGRAYRAGRRRQYRTLGVLLVVFASMVTVFSVGFHQVMAYEGRSFSWFSSVYWTLTTMTTLGYGDITFETSLGQAFSVLVLLSGSIFLLVMLPFVFIQFVFMPWMAQRELRRAPSSVHGAMHDHLIITEMGSVEASLIDRAEQAEVPYVLVVDELDEVTRLHDEGYSVIYGDLDDPQTYRNARAESAAMVVASRNDRANTNIAFTVSEIAPEVKIVATANSEQSIDILEIAGADRVLRLGEILGEAMAARTLGRDGRSHVIGEFAGLQIAEACAAGTALVGHSLLDLQLRARLGVGIIGVWNRGAFQVATGDTLLDDRSVLLLAATPQQLKAYDHEFSVARPDAQHIVIIGGGRVGRAVGRRLEAEGMSYTIVEQLAERERPSGHYVIGDAADRSVLTAAGIDRSDSILITTHDDDVNVYLTRYCRGLCPETRIVARSRLDRNVSTLYRAGADAVLSYSGTCSAAIWNELRAEETLLVAQGLNVFRTPVPRELAGKSLAEIHLHRRTQCNVVAVEHHGRIQGNPDASMPLPADAELVLVGTTEAEERFCAEFPHARRRVR